MVFEDVVRLAIELGAIFFFAFLVGMFLAWGFTKSVYIGLATGVCFGFLAWLLL